jgi:simple sugar transport system permease protein
MENGFGIEMSGFLAVLIAIGGSFIAGAFGALIYSVLVISLRTQQNVTGLALTIFGIGFGNFFGEVFGRSSPVGFVTISGKAREGFANLQIPLLSEIPVLGPLFFNYNILVYLAVCHFDVGFPEPHALGAQPARGGRKPRDCGRREH